MRFKNKAFQKFWRFSTSFQLGIPIIAALMILTIAGTIVESKYDAWTAQKMIYQSWMMYVVMGLLIYNLIIVMVDRLPWKKHHYPFILVHIGIITLIGGGWVTQKFGLDGSLRIPLNKSNQMVSVSTTDFTVYATFDGEKYTKIYDQELDLFRREVSAEKPIKFDLSYAGPGESINVIQYIPYARASQKVVVSDDPSSGSSIKFQLTNAQVTQVETLTQQNKNKVSETTLGLLNLYLGYKFETLGRKNPQANEAYFNALDNEHIQYAFFNKEEPKPYKTGKMKIGDVIPTRWMGLEVRLIDYVPQAKTQWDVVALEYPNALTSSAVQISMGDKKEWLVLNDTVKIFTDKVAYIVAYHNRQIPLDFKLHLDQFEITHYQGTQKAKEYASHVRVIEPEGPKAYISMNEPLKFNGYTFYQASFELDEKTGQPTASVFSVNQDPGRWIKYLGSIMLSLGIVWLFYDRRKRRTAV